MWGRALILRGRFAGSSSSGWRNCPFTRPGIASNPPPAGAEALPSAGPPRLLPRVQASARSRSPHPSWGAERQGEPSSRTKRQVRTGRLRGTFTPISVGRSAGRLGNIATYCVAAADLLPPAESDPDAVAAGDDLSKERATGGARPGSQCHEQHWGDHLQ